MNTDQRSSFSVKEQKDLKAGFNVTCLPVCLQQERMLNQSGGNSRARDVFGLRCLPGKAAYTWHAQHPCGVQGIWWRDAQPRDKIRPVNAEESHMTRATRGCRNWDDPQEGNESGYDQQPLVELSTFSMEEGLRCPFIHNVRAWGQDPLQRNSNIYPLQRFILPTALYFSAGPLTGAFWLDQVSF